MNLVGVLPAAHQRRTVLRVVYLFVRREIVKTSIRARLCGVAVVLVALCGMSYSANADLVHYWALNETVNPSTGTTAIDSAGASNGTYAGGTTGPVVGVAAPVGQNGDHYGTAATFGGQTSGTPDYVNVGNSLGSLTDGFTVAAWVNPAQQKDYNTILGTTGSVATGWQLDLGHGQGTATCLMLISGANNNQSKAIPSADFGNWMHVAATIDGTAGQIKYYLNGALFDTVASHVSSGTTDNYYIGWGNWLGAARGDSFTGGIDEVRVYNTVLGVDQIATLAGVPEPSTMMLMATGLIGLLAYAWRKRR